MENKDKFGSRIAGGNTAYKRVESDFYPTPPEATQALLDFLQIRESATIWEPACGEGHMVEVFQKNGYKTIGTDIQTGTNFLQDFGDDREFDWIITNPPFSLAEEFIAHAWLIGKPFAFLVKSQFWHAKKRYGLFKVNQPQYILPLTWRPDFMFKKRGGGVLSWT